MFKPLKRARIYEEIVTSIREMVDKGEFSPGDRLPSERTLSTAFRVSRPSVREALKTLEHQGYLEMRQGDGFFISLDPAKKLVEHLATAILSEKEFQVQILEMRRLIEPQIASLAAERATKDEMSRLEATLTLQKEKVSMGETGADLDKVFHYVIAQAAKNRLLMYTVDTATDLFADNRNRYLQIAERPLRSIKYHKEIFGAIADGNGNLAADVMNDHLDDIHETLFTTD